MLKLQKIMALGLSLGLLLPHSLEAALLSRRQGAVKSAAHFHLRGMPLSVRLANPSTHKAAEQVLKRAEEKALSPDLRTYNRYREPNILAQHDFYDGILPREDYPHLYAAFDEVIGKLWPHTELKDEKGVPLPQPEPILLDIDDANAFVSREHPQYIFFHLGLLREWVQYRDGKIYQEDIAVTLAHEIGHLMQNPQLKGRPLNTEMRQAQEYDADLKGVLLMEKSGYSVREAPTDMKLFKTLNGPEKTREKIKYLHTQIEKFSSLIEEVRGTEDLPEQKENDQKIKELKDKVRKILYDPEIQFLTKSNPPNIDDILSSPFNRLWLGLLPILNALQAHEENFKDSLITRNTTTINFTPWIPWHVRENIYMFLPSTDNDFWSHGLQRDEFQIIFSQEKSNITLKDIQAIETNIDNDEKLPFKEKRRCKIELREFFSNLKNKRTISLHERTHPMHDDRIQDFNELLHGKYFKHYKAALHPLSPEALSEIRQPTPNDSIVATLKENDHALVHSQIEKMNDPQKIIFLIAKLEPYRRTQDLKTIAQNRLQKLLENHPDLDEVFQFQLELLYAPEYREWANPAKKADVQMKNFTEYLQSVNPDMFLKLLFFRVAYTEHFSLKTYYNGYLANFVWHYEMFSFQLLTFIKTLSKDKAKKLIEKLALLKKHGMLPLEICKIPSIFTDFFKEEKSIEALIQLFDLEIPIEPYLKLFDPQELKRKLMKKKKWNLLILVRNHLNINLTWKDDLLIQVNCLSSENLDRKLKEQLEAVQQKHKIGENQIYEFITFAAQMKILKNINKFETAYGRYLKELADTNVLNAEYQNQIRNDLKTRLELSHVEWKEKVPPLDHLLDQLSPQLLNEVFLISYGVVTRLDDFKFFVSARNDQRMAFYQILRFYFPEKLIREHGLNKLADTYEKGTVEDKGATYNIYYPNSRIKTFNDYMTNLFIYLMFLNQKRDGENVYIPLIFTKHNKFLMGESTFGNLLFWSLNEFTRCEAKDEITQKGPIIRESFKEKHHLEKIPEMLRQLEGSIEEKNNSWPQVLEMVDRNMPPSILRNYYLYDLFLQLKDKNILTDTEIYQSYLELLPYLKEDIFMQQANSIKGSWNSLKHPAINSLSDSDRKYYEDNYQKFEEYSVYEPGTRQNALDLRLADMFQEETEKRLAAAPNQEEYLTVLKAAYPRPTRSRDVLLLKFIKQRLFALEQKNWEKDDFFKMLNLLVSPENKLEAGLWYLDFLFTQNPDATVKIRIEWVQEIFPERSFFRDDILANIERDYVWTAADQALVTPLKTRDTSILLEADVAHHKYMEDNFITALERLDSREKQKVILWLLHAKINGVDEKPETIKNLEIIYHIKADYLRENKGFDKQHFKDIGLSARKSLLQQLLVRGNRSIMESEQTEELIDSLWQSLVERFNPDFALDVSPKTNNLEDIFVPGDESVLSAVRLRSTEQKDPKVFSRRPRSNAKSGFNAQDNPQLQIILQTVFRHLEHDRRRQFKVLSEVLLSIEKLEQDPLFQNTDEKNQSDARMAEITRVFLKSTGLIGIKIAQYLSSSGQFNLSPAFEKALGELKDQAEAIDKPALFQMLETLGESKDLKVDKILGAASVKTSLSVHGSALVYKLMNLPVYYQAQKDLETLKKILADLVLQKVLSLEQDRDLYKEMEHTIGTESDFKHEMNNALTLYGNYQRRNKTTRGHWFYRKGLKPYIEKEIKRLEEKIPRRAPQYDFDFVQVQSIEDDVLIREPKVEGISLSDYKGDDQLYIYALITRELLAQVFEDGFFHADAHSGNIFIRDSKDAAGNTTKREIVFIDMGNARSVKPHEQSQLLSVVMHPYLKEALPSMGFFKRLFVQYAAKCVLPQTEIDELPFSLKHPLSKMKYLLEWRQELAPNPLIPPRTNPNSIAQSQ